VVSIARADGANIITKVPKTEVCLLDPPNEFLDSEAAMDFAKHVIDAGRNGLIAALAGPQRRKICSGFPSVAIAQSWGMHNRPRKIALGEMRAAGVRGTFGVFNL
jgi:hypothetical protein